MLILRGDDEHAHAGGDIDILVPSHKSIEACQLIATQAKLAGWYLLGFRNIEYVASITLVRPGMNGHDDAVKLDLISGLGWYGIGGNVVTNLFFDLQAQHAGDRVGTASLMAFATYLQKVMAAGNLNTREWSRITGGGVSHFDLLITAGRVRFPLLKDDVEENGVRRLRQWQLRMASSGFSGLYKVALWIPHAVYSHVRFKLGVGTGMGHLFSLSGLDGSGKSTQMERLFAAYAKAGGNQPKLVHLLPTWIPMPHQLFRRTQTTQNYTHPYAEAPVKSKLSGSLRLVYYLGAFFLTKCWLRVLTERGNVFVLDRSFVDFAADLARARIPDFSLPKWLIRLFTPKGTLLFLDALPDTVVKRKGELQLAKATVLRQRYLNVIHVVEGHVIDSEGTPDAVFVLILKQIDHIYRQRLLTLSTNKT